MALRENDVNLGDVFVRKGSKREWTVVSFPPGSHGRVELAAKLSDEFVPAPRRLVDVAALARLPWIKVEDREVTTWASLSWDGCGND